MQTKSLSATKNFIVDEISRGAAPAIATGTTIPQIIEMELWDAYEEARARGDITTAAQAQAELLW